MSYTPEEIAGQRDESDFPRINLRRFSCCDGMCGAEDCANCHGEDAVRELLESEAE